MYQGVRRLAGISFAGDRRPPPPGIQGHDAAVERTGMYIPRVRQSLCRLTSVLINLSAIQATIQAIGLHQLVVRTLFGNAAILKDVNPVGLLYCTQAVGNDQYCTALEELP